MSTYRDDNIQEGVYNRTPPQNVDLEMCVLGAIMLEPKEAFPLAQEYLSRESFYLDGHGIIFELMRELHTRGIPPDSVAVLDELRARGQMERVGGSAVVMGMLNSVPTAANVEYHSRKVAEKGNLRRMIRTCTELVDECYRQELAWEDIASRAVAGVNRVAEHGTQRSITPIRVPAREYWELLSKMEEEFKQYQLEGKTPDSIGVGIETKLYDLDRRRRLRGGEVTIIAAPPSVGKTALSLSIMHSLAVLQGIPCLLFSLEMSHQAVSSRMMAIGSFYSRQGFLEGVSTDQMEDPTRMDELKWNVLAQSYNKLTQAPIVINDNTGLTSMAMRSAVREFVTGYGRNGVVFLDYLGLMKATQDEKSSNRSVELGNISRAVKNLAVEFDLPFVVCSQLSRDSRKENREPRLHDLRDSGAIEQDADCVHMLYRHPDQDVNDIQQIKVLTTKNRNGPVGDSTLFFIRKIARFINAQR